MKELGGRNKILSKKKPKKSLLSPLPHFSSSSFLLLLLSIWSGSYLCPPWLGLVVPACFMIFEKFIWIGVKYMLSYVFVQIMLNSSSYLKEGLAYRLFLVAIRHASSISEFNVSFFFFPFCMHNSLSYYLFQTRYLVCCYL